MTEKLLGDFFVGGRDDSEGLEVGG